MSDGAWAGLGLLVIAIVWVFWPSRDGKKRRKLKPTRRQ